VVLFDPGAVTIGESKLVRITETTLRYEEERQNPLVQIVGAVPRARENPEGIN